MLKTTVFVAAACLLLPLHEAKAQRWKKYRHEVYGGIGATGFLGEVGGGDGPARDLLLDLDGKASRYCITGGYRYKLTEVLSARGGLTYGQIYGSDALTTAFDRRSRNLTFRSPIVELSGVTELYFVREKIATKYKVRGIKGALGSSISAYVFTGLAAFWYNPRGQFVGNATYVGDNKWYSLRKLGTEGQGLNGEKKYSPVSVSIPMGIAAKYSISREMSLSMEFGYRYAFTDYMDDVSGEYYDPIAIQAEHGDAAAWFSNPAVPVVKDNGDVFLAGGNNAIGQQRGDKTTNDTYLFAVLALNYKFISKKTNRPKF